MLELPNDVSIYSVRQEAYVKAKLVRLDRNIAAKQIDGTWWKLQVSKTLRSDEGDNHWEWRKLVGEHRNNANWDALGIQRSNDCVEGAILYRIDAKSQIEKGKGAVYVDRIATAPQNRGWLAGPPKYKGIGSVLLLAAVRHSYLLGLEGRVWLSSLPSEKTRGFYRGKGFHVIFEEQDGMIDFELSAAAAQKWLKDKGYLS
ncbi:GNAT family N-acetyltransferase [Planctomycetota bacterium]